MSPMAKKLKIRTSRKNKKTDVFTVSEIGPKAAQVLPHTFIEAALPERGSGV